MPAGMFGKYRLLERIAAGGMGETFLAEQERPIGDKKILVLKRILAHLSDREFVDAFLLEARLAARMKHRNFVQVFELGEEAGSFFIAMEYVRGNPLDAILGGFRKAHARLPLETVKDIAEQICAGASYAHNLCDEQGRSLNIIHRDLNPSNLLVGNDGTVKIIDFGIAKSAISTTQTDAGMIKGKFVYMSPEQALAQKLDKRSDLFSIGITLYEMLTGRNPFNRPSVLTALEAIQQETPPPPSSADPRNAAFDGVVMRALAKDRNDRYGDASEILEDLRRIVVQPANG